MNFLGSYELRARLVPCLIAIAPILVWAIVFGIEIGYIRNLFTLFVFMVICFPAMSFTREEGKKLEKKLFAEWGNPAVVMLRHSDNFLDYNIKSRYHKFLNKNVPNFKLLSTIKEQKNIKDADKNYKIAIDWLIENTRNPANFPIILNKKYKLWV